MPFRSELEASRARIAALEERVRELEAPGLARLARLRVAWLPAVAGGWLTGLAFGLAMGDADRPAWIVANMSILVGISATLWSWGRTGRVLPGWVFAVLKAALPVAAGWGWWSLSYDQVRQPAVARQSVDFFWYVPSLLVGLLVVEGALLARVLRRPTGP